MRGTSRPQDFLRLFVRAAATAGALVLAGGAAAQPEADMPEHGGDDVLAPIGLEYACGTRFVIINRGPEPVRVTYHVIGTGERGTVLLAEGIGGDPGYSETEIETRRHGAVEVLRDGERVAVRANERVSCGPSTAAAAAPVAAAAPAADGAWSAALPWGRPPGGLIVAVHLHLLPNGQVLSWGRAGEPYVWNPASGGFTQRPDNNTNLFCAGHSFLPDGRLFVAGGHFSDDHGRPDLNLFSTSGVWTSLPAMDRGRWYPTATTMGNGQVVITAGRDEDGLNVAVPEVWSPATPGAPPRRLTGASLPLPYYPRAFLAPNGRLFYAGEQQMTRYLNTSGAGSWTNAGNRRFGGRNYGAAVMYAPGKILYAGGGFTTKTAEIVDLNVSTTWRFTAPMAFARRHHNLTVLPNGEVLATGGVAGTTHNDLTKPVRAAEIWNPTTGTWRTVASNAIVRGYHGSSILLPDGRVLNTGSGDGGGGAPNQRNYELYSPPYLFAGTRPTIGSAPTTIRYSSTSFTVLTPNAATIAKVSLIRLGSVTHAFDMNQRYQTLNFTSNASGLTVSVPKNRNITPPGHYMLFILNSAGVPSVAKIVKVQA